jgi:hypothetical protein
MSDAPRGAKQRERTFSPEDLKLYYESPFASWMEKLHRDQPEHGVHPDLIATGLGTADEVDPIKNKIFVDQLIEAGNQVVVIANEGHEAGRQLQTVNAMRAGAHFIFDAHLSVVPLAGRIDILMRTPGESRLGDFHYLPAQFFHQDPVLTDLPVELCCFVDMLDHLQGKRPEEILQITNPNSATPHIARLPADGYMFDYRKLKIGYRKSQMDFDPESPPDPGASRHWGRWSRHARNLLTQKARQA